MTTTTPKPGPHMPARTTTAAEAAPDPQRPMFRDLAKRHAAASSDYLTEAGHMLPCDARDELLQLADVAAQVSLACSHIAPPARFRYVHRTEADK